MNTDAKEGSSDISVLICVHLSLTLPVPIYAAQRV